MDNLENFSIQESTAITYKILSAVHRLSNTASTKFVLMNLKGISDPNTVALGHHKFSTFRLLDNYSSEDIHFYIAQLIHSFHLLELCKSTNSLKIALEGVNLLKNKQEVNFQLKRTHKNGRPSNPHTNLNNKYETCSLGRPRYWQPLPSIPVKYAPVNTETKKIKSCSEEERHILAGDIKQSTLDTETFNSASLPKDTRPRYPKR